MQLWQHQLWRQLQERQRQQQLQQLDQEARQLTSHSHLPAMGKSATGNQLPATLNEMPINDPYNYMWPNSYRGGISNLANNPQVFITGNNLGNNLEATRATSFQNHANGGVMLSDQGQAMRSMGFLMHQNDQSFHGMPVSGANSADQFSHILAMPNNCTGLMSDRAATIAEKASFPPNTFQSPLQSAMQGFVQDKPLTDQNFQGRHVFVNSSMQVLGNDLTPANFQQLNNMQNQDHFQEFHATQEQVDLSGNLQEKPASLVGASSGVVSLDPIEQKLLFGTDNDDNWGGSLISAMGGDMHENPLETDHYDALPSIHSGSWSALMQEAVQASTSDKGLQEEWSGLSFQKTEQLTRTPFLVTNDSGKQPAPWDDGNLQNAASLTSRPFALFDESSATQSFSAAPSNKNHLKSSYEKNMVMTEAFHASLNSSLQEDSSREIMKCQHQTKVLEGGNQSKMSLTSGIWAGKTIEQCENNSDIQFKSQNIVGGWIGQQNVSSSVSVQPFNSLDSWNSSSIITSGNNASNYHEIHDNHINLNSGSQPGKLNVGSPRLEAEDSSAGNLGSVRNPNTLRLNRDMHQQVINEQNSVFGRNSSLNTNRSFSVDKVEENRIQPSRRIQPWELSRMPAAERLVDNSKKEKENFAVLSGKAYIGDTEKEIFVSGSEKHTFQLGQHPSGSKVFQNSPANLRNTAESSLPSNHQLSLQGLPNSTFDGSGSVEQSFAGSSHFPGHIICNKPLDTSKRIAAEAEDMRLGKSILPSVAHSSFDGSSAQYSQNETVSQARNNMLELLHKVDQSRNANSVNGSENPAQATSDVAITHPHFDWSSNKREFGLRLAPPSQRQPQSNHAPIAQKLASENKAGQSGHNAGYQDQKQSNYTSSACEVSKTEKWDKISRQQQIEHAEENKYFNSPGTATDFSSVGNQLKEQQNLQQHDHSGAKGHLEQQQQHESYTAPADEDSVNFSFSNQANVSALDGAVTGQAVQRSLLSLAGSFSVPGVASSSENHVSGGSQLSSGGTDTAFTGFPNLTNSGQKSVEEKSGLQSSTLGMSQQAGFSKMLHNVWTNISTQQRQAGINPLLTPNILQSIINHGRDKGLWGMPKADDHVNKEGAPEVGTSSNLRKEGNSVPFKTSNTHTETVDAVSKSKNPLKGEQAVLTPPFDGISSIPISSLVRLHQQDVNKDKRGQDSAICSRGLHSPLTTVVSSSSDIGMSGHASKHSDGQQKNYSLLHQIQSMKGSESYINKMTGNVRKGDSMSCISSQMNSNMYQRFDDGQNSVSRYPADVKLQVASQVSVSSDAKMLSFASSVNEERNPGTSTAGQNDLQIHTHPLGASSMVTLPGCSERAQISPQMAPSWLEHYGTYQNGRIVAPHDAQRSGKAAMDKQFLEKVPAGMEDSTIMEQTLPSNQVGSYRKSTLVIKTSPNESYPQFLLPDIIDRGTILRSKKRKIVTSNMPWQKVVSERPPSLQSISMADLDWNLAACRLMEKTDDEAETMEDDSYFSQSRRRLILTTQLTQQLIPAVPAALLKGETASTYEDVTFYVAKSALADACSLILTSKRDSPLHLENENMVSGEFNPLEKVGDGIYSKIMEDFDVRSKKLEADFSRLNNGASLLDVRLECQELERFSIVNRLGKFHGRAHADGVQVSASGTVLHRIFPQRYITALPVPGNLPEGVPCLSL